MVHKSVDPSFFFFLLTGGTLHFDLRKPHSNVRG